MAGEPPYWKIPFHGFGGNLLKYCRMYIALHFGYLQRVTAKMLRETLTNSHINDCIT